MAGSVHWEEVVRQRLPKVLSSIDPMRIQNAWNHTGIIPFNPNQWLVTEEMNYDVKNVVKRIVRVVIISKMIRNVEDTVIYGNLLRVHYFIIFSLLQ